MGLRELHLKKAYLSDSDDILNEFYIPVLRETIEYKRLTGFFSSKSLAIAARGIVGLIKNEGIMKLITSPLLTKNDIEIITKASINPEKYIEKRFLQEIENLENEFIEDHLHALAWMIANNKLEIKIAFIYDKENLLPYEFQDDLFHPKIGILKDPKGNMISFSGSINESAKGWLGNIEEFKVFREWISAEKDYFNNDVSKFNRLWHNSSSRIKIVDLPYAIKQKLLEIAPKKIDEIKIEKWYKKRIKLFEYQEKAVNRWINNDMKGIFEMATGTGKTFTALACLERILKSTESIVTIIACPFQHLLRQWKDEINKFGISYDTIIFADSSNRSWRDRLADVLVEINLHYKKNLIILTTYNTFSSEDFIKIIKTNKNENLFLIADEVHNVGAKKMKDGLIDSYNFRLGLSATPKRWMDQIGTHVIYDYFSDVVFEFSLEKAINTINPATGKTYLTPYKYKPKFISLQRHELNEYVEKSKSIAIKYNKTKNSAKEAEILNQLIFERADIIKNAQNKYQCLIEILNQMDEIKWCLIYCTPNQIDTTMQILLDEGLIIHRFTMDEGAKPSRKYNGLSEREVILNYFAEGKYQVLVAMRCLDEGVDIPPARIAVLLGSSGNPREYIQRIGRVIRRYPDKIFATIHDIIVIPSLLELPPNLREAELKIFEKEIKRYEEIASIAINNAEALKKIYEIKEKLWR